MFHLERNMFEKLNLKMDDKCKCKSRTNFMLLEEEARKGNDLEDPTWIDPICNGWHFGSLWFRDPGGLELV